ncbi:MAG: hypothetical protein AB7I30_18490 [Isosphaeraceae bacterium]
MRIRLLTFPQHVALRDGQRWISPVREIERYVEVSRRHLASRTAAFLWVAGGLVAETGFTAVGCLLALWLGWRSVAFWIAMISLSMYMINIFLMDLPQALIRRNACGDTSGLWVISRPSALVVTLAMLAIRATLVWSVLR